MWLIVDYFCNTMAWIAHLARKITIAYPRLFSMVDSNSANKVKIQMTYKMNAHKCISIFAARK